MTTLGEAAAWHEREAEVLRQSADVLKGMGVPAYREPTIVMHERFAIAIREADGAEPETLP